MNSLSRPSIAPRRSLRTSIFFVGSVSRRTPWGRVEIEDVRCPDADERFDFEARRDPPGPYVAIGFTPLPRCHAPGALSRSLTRRARFAACARSDRGDGDDGPVGLD